jgi:hypothetical protein
MNLLKRVAKGLFGGGSNSSTSYCQVPSHVCWNLGLIQKLIDRQAAFRRELIWRDDAIHRVSVPSSSPSFLMGAAADD